MSRKQTKGYIPNTDMNDKVDRYIHSYYCESVGSKIYCLTDLRMSCPTVSSEEFIPYI